MRRSQEKGVYLAIVAIGVVAILALVTLFLGSGYLAGNQEVLRMNANSLAMAAMEGYSSTTGAVPGVDPTYNERIIAGLARAEAIFQQNKKNLIGVDQDSQKSLELVYSTTSKPKGAGQVLFGFYFPELSADSTAKGCSKDETKFPCFVPITSATGPGPASAARVTLLTQGGISVPFLSGLQKNLTETSYAFVVPRCVAAAVDLSGSTMHETHPYYPPGNPVKDPPGNPACPNYIQPQNTCARLNRTKHTWETAGLFTFFKTNLGNFASNPFCTLGTTPFPWEKLFFCSMYRDRTDFDTTGFVPPLPEQDDLATHFTTDYSLSLDKDPSLMNFDDDGEKFWTSESTYEQVLVDRLKRSSDPYADASPEPFGRFMRGINGMLRVLREVFTHEDRAVLIGFAGQIITTVPGPIYFPRNLAAGPTGPVTNKTDPGFPGLTKNLEYLMQITNTRNIGFKTWNAGTNEYATGVATPVYPNFITKGFFPVMSSNSLLSGTNMLQAITSSALKILAPPAGGETCPSIAKKGVIIFSDGANTCLPDDEAGGTPWSNLAAGWPAPTYRCGRSVLTDADPPPGISIRPGKFDNMWDTSSDAVPYYLNNPTNGLAKYANEARVSISVILDGDQILGNPSDPVPVYKVTEVNGKFLRPSDLKLDSTKAADLYMSTPICPPDWCGEAKCKCTDQLVMQHLGEPGWILRKPLVVYGEFAARTYGEFVPLLPECTSCGGGCNCYESDEVGAPISDCGINAKKLPDDEGGYTLNCSMVKGSKAEQAAWAASRIAATSPYGLTAPAYIAANALGLPGGGGKGGGG